MRAVWSCLRAGVRTVLNRRRSDDDLAEEVAGYAAELEADYVAAGHSRQEARRSARLALGGELQVRETVRAHGWENAVESAAADARVAWRRLRATPGFTIVALVTLAVGIGSATAVFSAVHRVLIEPLPYPAAERVSLIREVAPDGAIAGGTFAMYRAFRERAHSFESLAVLAPWQPTLSGVGTAERLSGQRVSAGFLDVLGVYPAVGRNFRADEDRPGGGAVVLIGHALWQRRFAGDVGLPGGMIRLDGVDHTVIGILPRGFHHAVAPDAELYTLLQYDVAEGRAWGHHLRTIGRLRPGVARDGAERELNDVAQALIADATAPTYSGDERWTAPSLQREITREVRPALYAVTGAVLLLLLLTCVNVANLLLTRGALRRDELALRAALGARRGRLIRESLAESVLLACLGGAAGAGIAALGIRALAAIAPADVPRLAELAVHTPVLVIALAVTATVGLLAGLAPALAAGRVGTAEWQRGGRATAGRSNRHLRSAFVVTQVAVAVVLLAGSGLLLRSVQKLLAVPPGFDAASVATLHVQATGERYGDDAARRAFFDAVLAAAAAVPGVADVALTNQLALSGNADTWGSWGVHFEHSPTQRTVDERSAFRYSVSPAYFDVLRIPLRGGRLLTQYDDGNAPRVAVISASLAQRRFPAGDALGQRLRIGPLDSEPFTVVGIVGDVRHESLALEAADAVYIPMHQWRWAESAMTLVARTDGEPGALLQPLHAAIRGVDPEQAVSRVARLTDYVAASAAERRFILALFQAFAAAALLLAAAGLYGVVSGGVSERMREFGIRGALGASRRKLLAEVLATGLHITAAGVVAGIAGAIAAGRLMRSLLYEVSPLDSATFVVVVAILVAVSVLACAAPALRASRVDPAVTLRMD